jgi:uncharacterized Zn ribbon protein
VAFVLVVGVLAQGQCNPTITDFVSKSGYKFEADPKCAFWVSTDALTIPHDDMQGSLMIAERGDIVMVVAVIKLKGNLDHTPATLAKLMRLNNDMLFVKVGIDPDGDLFLRAELHKKSLDAETLKDAFDRVKNGSQKVYDATQ